MLVAHSFILVGLLGQMNTTHHLRMVLHLPRVCENLRSRQMKPLIHIGNCTTKAVYPLSTYGTQKILVDLEILLVLLSSKRVRIHQCSIVQVWQSYTNFDLSLAMTPMTAYEPEGSWDSIHVFETAERGRQAHYKLTSTVMLHLLTRKGTDNDDPDTDSKGPEGWRREGEVSLSGSMTRQVCTWHCYSRPALCQRFWTISMKELFYLGQESCYSWTMETLWSGKLTMESFQTEQDWPIHDTASHISNIGRMIEEMEIKMRNLLQEVRYLGFFFWYQFLKFGLPCVGLLWQDARYRLWPPQYWRPWESSATERATKRTCGFYQTMTRWRDIQ